MLDRDFRVSVVCAAAYFQLRLLFCNTIVWWRVLADATTELLSRKDWGPWITSLTPGKVTEVSACVHKWRLRQNLQHCNAMQRVRHICVIAYQYV